MGLSACLLALRRFAFARPRAFVVIGEGGRAAWSRALGTGRVERALAPHDADVLLLAGAIPGAWAARLRALFETVALPRACAWLPPARPCAPPPLPAFEVRDERGWDSLINTLISYDSPANRPLLADAPPAPSRDAGADDRGGQGREGTMGRRPYGRPMATTHADERDGLALDDVPTAAGPFFPGLPHGLAMVWRMQGERVRAVASLENLYPRAATATPDAASTVADVERARLSAHLHWMGEFLWLCERPGLAVTAHRLAVGTPTVAALARLVRAAERGGFLRRLCRGVGVITPALARAVGALGPVARASGITEDARLADPAYQGLGFEIIAETGADVWSRWRVRARECLRSCALIETGAGRRVTPPLERARGPDTTPPASARHLRLLERLLPDLTWSQVVLTVASLDLDMAEAA